MFATESIEAHYGRGDVLASILQGLRAIGKDVNSLTVDDLAPVDEFHSRGRVSTEELLALSPIAEEDKVLDVGCGLGGSARYIAKVTGSLVTGIDLTDEYIHAAKTMTQWVGMANQIQFIPASALQLPFEDNSFDVVWTEHAQMNISDKQKFYSEIARVLRPEGRFLFHDIFGGANAPTFPVPWAEESSISHLATEVQAKNAMDSAGLEIQQWLSKVDQSVGAFEKVLEKIAANGMPPLGINLLMGESAHQKIKNYVSSMKAGNLEIALGVCVNRI